MARIALFTDKRPPRRNWKMINEGARELCLAKSHDEENQSRFPARRRLKTINVKIF